MNSELPFQNLFQATGCWKWNILKASRHSLHTMRKGREVFTQHLLLSAWKGATHGAWKQVHQRVQNFQGCRRETFYKPSVFGLLFN